ncbi:MAG: caspase family protein [Bauldia sp.]
MRSVVAILLTVFLFPVATLPVMAGTRVALVIGNSAYANVSELANPKNDGAALAKALRGAGFDEVTELRDLDQAGLRRALKEFTANARGAETALIYYAGHGVEVGGTNYLVPVDATLAQATDVEFEAVPLDNVRTAVSGATKLRLIILDACRNNPFKLAASGGKRSVGRGLARVEPNANELIAYAAREGTVASDGRAGNSPYATALVKYLGKPGLEIRLLFGQVRDDVVAATAGEQEPFTYGTLGGEAIFLNGASASSASQPADAGTASKPVSEPGGSLLTEAAAAWAAAQGTTSAAVLKAYIARYKGTIFGEMAVARLEELQGAAAPAPASTPSPSPSTSPSDEDMFANAPPEDEPADATPVVARSLTIEPQVTAVGKWAEGVAFDGHSLWVAESGQRTIAELDPDSRALIRRVNVGRLPVGMEATADGRVFSLVQTDKSVWMQAPGAAKGKRLASLKDCPQDIAVTDKAVWVLTLQDCSSADSRALAINLKTGKQAQTVWLGEWGQALAAGLGKIWVAHVRGGIVNMIDPDSLAVDNIVIDGASFWDVATNSSRVFAGGRIGEDNAQGLIVAIDPASGREVARRDVDQMINVIVADDASVVALGLDGRIWVLSAETLAIEKVIDLTTGAFRPSDALIVGDRLFVVCQQCDGENGAVLTIAGLR